MTIDTIAVPQNTIWKLDPHTKAKHVILQRYLEAWFPILNQFHEQIVYIDGFCGPGRYAEGEEGSPIIAINVAKNHPALIRSAIKFIFIDKDAKRIEHLQKELGQLSIPKRFATMAKCGLFHEQLTPILDSIEKNSRKSPPIFAFIDPFGFAGIPYSIIKRILEFRGAEVFINFMVDSINRFLEHPNGEISENIIEAFGHKEPINIARRTGDRVRRLRTLYQAKLEDVAKFVRYFEMRDRRGRVQYYLFFASNHELGHVKMKEAMWKVDPTGQFSFSDATNPDQIVLLQENEIDPLRRNLLSTFPRNKELTGDTIRLYIENETAYIKKHMTACLKLMEEAGEIKVSDTKTDGKKRRANSYPDTAIISFQ